MFIQHIKAKFNNRILKNQVKVLTKNFKILK